MTRVPERDGDGAVALGSNWTEIVQVPDAETGAEQPFFTTEKSVELATTAEETASSAGAAAVFVIVKVWGELGVPASWAGKLADGGVTEICAWTAVPLTAMDCGLCGALSEI